MKTFVSKIASASVFFLFSSLSLCLAQPEETSAVKSNVPVVQSKKLTGSSTPITDVKDVEASMLVAQQSVDFVASDIFVVNKTKDINRGILFDKNKEEFKNVETYPVPENGVELGSVLQGLINYPQSAIDEGIEGVVKVLCMVEKDGGVSSVVILNDIGANCAEEVCRVVRSVKFKPAMQNGYPRRCTLIIPVVFNLTGIE